MKKIKCQCPDEAKYNLMADMMGYLPEEEAGKIHRPNKCKGTYELQEYIRDGKKIWLCSCCIMFGDEPTGKMAK